MENTKFVQLIVNDINLIQERYVKLQKELRKNFLKLRDLVREDDDDEAAKVIIKKLDVAKLINNIKETLREGSECLGMMEILDNTLYLLEDKEDIAKVVYSVIDTQGHSKGSEDLTEDEIEILRKATKKKKIYKYLDEVEGFLPDPEFYSFAMRYE